MKRYPAFLRRSALALLTAATLGTATAAPYATTTTGTIGASGFTSVATGQPYNVTLVFDNGGASAASQTWEMSDLTCVIWRFNTAQNVVFAHNLAGAPPTAATGAIATDAGGALTGMFADLSAQSIAPASVSASGFVPALAGAPNWFVGTGDPFFFDAGNTPAISSSGGGVPVAPANWSAPAPFNSPCPAPGPGGTVPQATPVPVLGMGGLTLLAGLLGAVGWRTRRRGT